MCGRFYIDDEMAEEINELVRDISRKQQAGIRTGDYRPSEPAAVLLRAGKRWQLAEMKWGFSGREGSGLLINARSESVLEKPTFADSIRARRCVIPVSGFYEWNSRREKYRCFRREHKAMYLAGCFKADQGEPRFVILTTAANASMSPVHERMPLILPEEALISWLEVPPRLNGLLLTEPEYLECRTDYQQLTLDLF